MRKFFFIVLFGLIAATLAYAQENKAKTAIGSKAFHFTLNGFGGFGPNGELVGTTPLGTSAGDSILGRLNELVGQRFVRPVFGFGITFYVANNVGLRIGLGANMGSNTTPRANDTTGKEDTDTRLAVAFSPGVVIHLANSGPVSVYTGAVLSVADALTWTGADSTARTDQQFGFSAAALLGAEVYIFDNLSLGAETQIGVESTSTSVKIDKTTTDGPSSFAIGFTTPVRVSLSFHI